MFNKLFLDFISYIIGGLESWTQQIEEVIFKADRSVKEKS